MENEKVNNKKKMNDGMIFLFGVILATVVELIAGWLLDVCFHARWWDYSDKPINFHGYKSVIHFLLSLGCTFMPDFGIGWSSCDKLSVKSKEKVAGTIVSLGRKNDSDKGNN